MPVTEAYRRTFRLQAGEYLTQPWLARGPQQTKGHLQELTSLNQVIGSLLSMVMLIHQDGIEETQANPLVLSAQTLAPLLPIEWDKAAVLIMMELHVALMIILDLLLLPIAVPVEEVLHLP